METHNITSWGGFAEILTASQAHVLLLQETHADEIRDKELRATAAKLGWRMISSQAEGKRRHFGRSCDIDEKLAGAQLRGGSSMLPRRS